MRGRKPKQELRSMEFRQKLLIWKQMPEFCEAFHNLRFSHLRAVPELSRMTVGREQVLRDSAACGISRKSGGLGLKKKGRGRETLPMSATGSSACLRQRQEIDPIGHSRDIRNHVKFLCKGSSKTGSSPSSFLFFFLH